MFLPEKRSKYYMTKTDEADSLKDVLAQKRKKKMSSLQAESRESKGNKRSRTREGNARATRNDNDNSAPGITTEETG